MITTCIRCGRTITDAENAEAFSDPARNRAEVRWGDGNPDALRLSGPVLYQCYFDCGDLFNPNA